jgi:GTP pyrophosphokinase
MKADALVAQDQVRIQFESLLRAVQEHRSDANLERIREAFEYSEKAHENQFRESGEPYILHPIAVAAILAELKMDDDTLCAALLHDVLEDCPEPQESQVAAKFGEDVVALVDGVTKLKLDEQVGQTDRQRAAAKSDQNAETLRKMLLAMSKDFRVMVIKLADRLHNMSTLGSVSQVKKVRVATETLDIYAPLAARLGVWQIKWQLEDLSFQVLHPREYLEVKELVGNTRKQREEQLDEVISNLTDRCRDRGIKVLDIRGRPKHLFSIWTKMIRQGLKFEEIHDLLALRIIVELIPDCYVALGAVNEAYIPIPQLFYDYIARPKPNGYQSLHTKVLGPTGQPLEIQIRTLEMHQIAEFGVAAHWTYKEGRAAQDELKRLQTLRQQLFDWSSDSRTSSDFLRTLSTDLFSEQAFVFTPKGDVIDLAAGATPVDFAFRVHTDLGMRMIGARVNGQMVPLSTPLKNGDIVEVIDRSNAQPSLDWLEFVKTSHARSRLRAYFRRLNKNEDASRGRAALEKEIRSAGLDPKLFLTEQKLADVAKQTDACETGHDLLAKVGAGTNSVQSVVAKLRGITPDHERTRQVEVTKTREGKLTLQGDGLDGILVNRARCCNPIPGDEVVGYVTRGRGILVHRKVCPNALAYVTNEPERLMPYIWRPDGNVYAVPLKIVSVNRVGLMADVSTILGEAKTNISGLKAAPLPNQTYEINVTIEVSDTDHLNYVMNRIANLSDIMSILRLFSRVGK